MSINEKGPFFTDRSIFQLEVILIKQNHAKDTSTSPKPMMRSLPCRSKPSKSNPNGKQQIVRYNNLSKARYNKLLEGFRSINEKGFVFTNKNVFQIEVTLIKCNYAKYIRTPHSNPFFKSSFYYIKLNKSISKERGCQISLFKKLVLSQLDRPQYKGERTFFFF